MAFILVVGPGAAVATLLAVPGQASRSAGVGNLGDRLGALVDPEPVSEVLRDWMRWVMQWLRCGARKAPASLYAGWRLQASNMRF
jgi:hypothetical protein